MTDTVTTIATLADDGLARTDTPLRTVAEHAVFLLYPFGHATAHWPFQPTETLSALAGQAWLPVSETERKVHKERLIWVPAAWPLTDLDPQVAGQLTWPDENGAPTVWTLDPQRHVRQWLTCGQTPGTQLRLPLSPSAQHRLDRRGLPRTESVGLEFGAIRLLPFRTGQGVLLVEIRFTADGPISDTLLVEATTALCHDRGLEWRSDRSQRLKTVGGKDRFTLAAMLTSLIQFSTEKPLSGQRVFSYAFAAFDERLNDRDRCRLLIQLSRKYTDDYRIADASGEAPQSRVFDTIAHAAYSEGCATLVERIPADGAQKPPAFLTGFLKNAVEGRYLGIAAINVHAREALLRLSRDSSFWPNMDNPSETQIEDLGRLQKQILAFRLAYRVSRVSPVSMHNGFHEALTKAFRLEELLRDINKDALEIGAYLQELEAGLRKASERKWRWVAKLLISAAALSALKDIYDFINDLPTFDLSIFGNSKAMISILIFLIVGFIAYVWGMRDD